VSTALNFNVFEQLTFVLPTIVEQGLLILALIALFTTLTLAYSRLTVKSSVEQKSENRLRFVLVAIINIVAFIAMIVLISEVKIPTKSTGKHILITQGGSLQQLSSLSLSDKDHLYVLPQYRDKLDTTETVNLADFVKSNTQKINQIDDIQQLMLLQPNLSSLMVLGDGLTEKQRAHLAGVELSFKLSPALLGPVAMSWNKQLFIGQTLAVQGVFQSRAGHNQQIYQIELQDINAQSLASTRLKNNEPFKFTSIPKTTGLFVYQLKIFDQNDTLLVSEPIAFEVIKPVLPAIVIQQSSASFESRHLKNWAEQQGSKLLLLTQVSKNKHMQQRVNFLDDQREVQNVDNKKSNDLVRNLRNGASSVTSLDANYELLAHTWLQDFDMLFMDGRALLALSTNEQVELQQAIINGLGLFIWADDSLIAAFATTKPQLLTLFQLASITDDNGKELNKNFLTNAWWENSPNNPNSYQELKERTELIVPYKNVNMSAEQAMPLVYGGNNKPLVLNTSFGLGKIAVSLVNHSYQWSTSGQKSGYSQYWQYLMLNIARNRQQSHWQDEADNEISYLGESFQLCARTSEKAIVSDLVLLQQRFAKESTYCGIDWSTKLAWQRHHLYKNQETNTIENTINNAVNATINNTVDKKLSNNILLAQQARYIYPQNSWLTWQQAQKHQASRQLQQKPKGNDMPQNYQPINKKIIWMIFFISLSLLWIEQKSFK
jgi:hypothetical protein